MAPVKHSVRLRQLAARKTLGMPSQAVVLGALIGLFQWGLGNEFMVLMIVYAVIQALDGNVLVPILFSEAVNLHPVAIIAAVLIFGGLWGFWGVFFAIPLATLFKAIGRRSAKT